MDTWLNEWVSTLAQQFKQHGADRATSSDPVSTEVPNFTSAQSSTSGQVTANSELVAPASSSDHQKGTTVENPSCNICQENLQPLYPGCVCKYCHKAFHHDCQIPPMMPSLM